MTSKYAVSVWRFVFFALFTSMCVTGAPLGWIVQASSPVGGSVFGGFSHDAITDEMLFWKITWDGVVWQKNGSPCPPDIPQSRCVVDSFYRSGESFVFTHGVPIEITLVSLFF